MHSEFVIFRSAEVLWPLLLIQPSKATYHFNNLPDFVSKASLHIC